jgi:hypothetical protein
MIMTRIDTQNRQIGTEKLPAAGCQLPAGRASSMPLAGNVRHNAEQATRRNAFWLEAGS